MLFNQKQKADVEQTIHARTTRDLIETAPRDPQTDLLWGKFQKLRNYLGDQTPEELRHVTYQRLRQSSHLRNMVDHFSTIYLLRSEKAPGSFDKHYTTERQKTIDREAQVRQSSELKFVEDIKETHNHNIDMLKEYLQGEEGIDYEHLKEGEVDPMRINPKKLAREIRNEIKAYKVREPELAEEMEKFIFEDNDVDAALDSAHLDESEVKYYPGSDKGPNPEDDPEFYSDWFVNNQPKVFQEGDGKELGMKKKFISTIQATSTNEEKTHVEYFFEHGDEAFPMANYEGAPEFDIFPVENYNVKDESEIPQITFKTNQGTDELGPEMDRNNVHYQRYIWDMEPWTIFRTLPSVIHYDNTMQTFFRQVQQGLVQIPDYKNDINPPSLWAYYHTLPSWARNHPIIRNVMMGMEYHKPGVDIRQKELALNFACSFLRPIDEQLTDVISEVASSTKIRLNMAAAKEMLQEVRFHRVDIHDLGTDSEEEEDDDADREK